MNQKQLELMGKEWEINANGDFTISRSLYESFPCPMMAFLFTDKEMQELANKIGLAMKDESEPTNEREFDDLEDLFIKVAEETALDMGMKYYEDFSEEEFKVQKEIWNNIK